MGFTAITCASFLPSFAKTLRTYKRSTNVQEKSIEADDPCSLRFGQRFKLVLANPGVEDSDRVQHAHAGHHCTPGAQHDRPGPPAAFRTFCGAIGIFVLLVLGFVWKRDRGSHGLFVIVTRAAAKPECRFA